MPSDHQLSVDIVLKFLPFDKLFCPDEQNEGAVGRSQHTVDLVDADVAVFCRFSGGQCHFVLNEIQLLLVQANFLADGSRAIWHDAHPFRCSPKAPFFKKTFLAPDPPSP